MMQAGACVRCEFAVEMLFRYKRQRNNLQNYTESKVTAAMTTRSSGDGNEVIIFNFNKWWSSSKSMWLYVERTLQFTTLDTLFYSKFK